MHIKALATGGAALVKPGAVPGSQPGFAGQDFRLLLTSSSSSLLSRSMAERWAKAVFRIRGWRRTGVGHARILMGKNNDRPGQHHSGTGQQGSPEPAPTCKALPRAALARLQLQSAANLQRGRALVHGVEVQAGTLALRNWSHRSVTTSRPNALMLAVSSPNACRRSRIQRGISAPQASENASAAWSWRWA